MINRCSWCGDDPLYVNYHDQEWGVPLHEDTALFECLTLEGAQAGLSWITVLRKREGYRSAFDHFGRKPNGFLDVLSFPVIVVKVVIIVLWLAMTSSRFLHH